MSTVKMGIFSPLADPLVGSIATQYLQNREEHDRIARLWTKRYATWCVGVESFVTSREKQHLPDYYCKPEKKLIPICRSMFPPPIPVSEDVVYCIWSVCGCRFSWAFSTIVNEKNVWILMYSTYIIFKALLGCSLEEIVGIVPSSLNVVIFYLSYEKS